MYVRDLALELGPLGVLRQYDQFATSSRREWPGVCDNELACITEIHRKIVPLAHARTTEEVGRFVSLLLDQRAEWVNGATIDFTGGMTQSLLDVVLMRP